MHSALTVTIRLFHLHFVEESLSQPELWESRALDQQTNYNWQYLELSSTRLAL